ncbi:ATP-binding cassette domain-containing protein [Blastopirellula marina]|uniref:ATP-binding protein Uup n=1 Tax=Blastopirellula marina TaxID=124 RepID=A0A2S8G2I8_9BACT|nr:ATP-binding cassette domain-containing protein [Blastopirellula marina]PQO38657.1 ABC transporter ATP-binding protein [Blastopirellula marina]PTL45314.1 ABC transporter ATP-binding protein [Blastopirellula marina]
MPLITLKNVRHSYHDRPLFTDVNLVLEPGQRVCLMGRNGAGKSTLLKILAGEVVPDDGEVAIAVGLTRAQMAQTVPTDDRGTVYDVVADGVGNLAAVLREYHTLTHQLAENASDEIAKRLDELQHEIDSNDGWNLQNQIEQTLTRTGLDGELVFQKLSAGMKRRVLLARALVNEPDLLLMDEPTNHLDIDSILWLEKLLLNTASSIVFVTHDRAFARKLATRVIDVDRGRVTSWSCGYDDFLKRKAEALEAEEKQQALFDKKLAQEEAWIRQGIKARRTRNEGRVRALKKLREEFRDRRKHVGSVKMEAHAADRSGQLVFKADNLSHRFGDLRIVDDFSTVIMRGDKVGIIGRNGIGKSTLLRILLGQLKPDKGQVKVGTNVQIAYFDQLQARLDPEQTLRANIGEGNEFIQVNGKSKHVVGYLQEFLFTPEQANRAIKYLSGGERNRLLLAQLFAKPSNVLVLDEPTNDLDSDTMELLEDLVVNYPGTILVVSHDREFLNNVVTSTIVFEGDGIVREYAGGYDDYLVQRNKEVAPMFETTKAETKPTLEAKPATPKKADASGGRGKKLSYKEQRELDNLPDRIAELEAEQEKLQAKIADPGFYQRPQDEIKQVSQRVEEIGEELLLALERWEELATIQETGG